MTDPKIPPEIESPELSGEPVIAEVVEPPLGGSSNPYLSLNSDTTALSPLDPLAEVENPKSGRNFGLPHIGYSLLWTLVLLFVQLSVGLVIGLAGLAAYMAAHEPPLTEEVVARVNEQIMPFLLPAGTLTTLFTALGASRLLLGRDVWRRLGFRWINWGQLVVILAMVPPLQILASEVSNVVSRVMPNLSGDTFTGIAQQPWIIVLIGMCLLPGLGEEIFFRGFLGRGLIARHGVILGTLLTALLFGIVHVDPVQASGAFALGIALQYIFLATKSLVAPIIVHVANNTLAFWALRYGDLFPIRGLTVIDEAGPDQTPFWILITAAVAVTGLSWLLYRCRTRWVNVDGTDWSPGYISAESPPRNIPVRAQAASLGLDGHLFSVAICTMLFAVLRQHLGS